MVHKKGHDLKVPLTKTGTTNKHLRLSKKNPFKEDFF